MASFVLGLRDDSRLKMKLQNRKLSTENYLLAGIFDRLSLLVWSKTKDAMKGRNRPKLLLDLLEKKSSEFNKYYSSEDFEKERKNILKEIEERGI